MRQWKNFENRSIFHKDMDKTLWLTFLGHPVGVSYTPSWQQSSVQNRCNGTIVECGSAVRPALRYSSRAWRLLWAETSVASEQTPDLTQTMKVCETRLWSVLSSRRDVFIHAHVTDNLHTEASNTVSWWDSVLAGCHTVDGRRHWLQWYRWAKPLNLSFDWVQLQSSDAELRRRQFCSCVATVAACDGGTPGCRQQNSDGSADTVQTSNIPSTSSVEPMNIWPNDAPRRTPQWLHRRRQKASEQKRAKGQNILGVAWCELSPSVV